jgi:hypothetical protein
MKRKCKQWWSTSPPICTNNHLWPQLNEHWKWKRPWNDVYDDLYIFAMYHHIYANYGKPMWPCFVPEKIISDIQFLQTCLSFKQNKMMFWPIVTVVFNIFLMSWSIREHDSILNFDLIQSFNTLDNFNDYISISGQVS